MNGARIFCIAFHSLIAGLLALGALAKHSVYYDPSGICRLLCAIGAFVFAWEVYSMIHGDDPKES
jgi:hypothetical protein